LADRRGYSRQGSQNYDERIAGTMSCAWKSLAAVCVLVIGVYAYMAQSSAWEMWSRDGADSNYNLLVQGFQARQLGLKKEVPPGFTRLADPFDPVANTPYRGDPYRLNDLSYYKGRLYLYFGVTPALILFWPYVAVTGHYLFHRQAVLIFCTVGFLASVGLLRALWRRYFPEVSVGVVAACALALGLATGVPEQLSQADFYQVALSCGYMLIMLALGAIWSALHEPEGKKCRWLATASVAYGLAVGARPSLLFGAVILLVPVFQAWRGQWRRVWALLLAATVPILLIGLGLMLYNVRRFDSPFEFGQHYEVNFCRQLTRQMFGPRYLWFNFQFYFLQPAHWSARFPFVHEIPMNLVPPGDPAVGGAFGILTTIPLAWLALAVPLAWRSQSGPSSLTLRWFVTAVASLFGICALTLGLFWSANFRYELDFLPALVLLAVMGIFGLERALANRPVQRCAVRWGWGLLLGFSVVFNLLVTVGHYAEVHNDLGSDLYQAGKVPEAIREFEYALRLNPDSADAHVALGTAVDKLGRHEDAIRHWEEALRIKPDCADAHYNLGLTSQQSGRLLEAVAHYEQALRIKPNDVEAHYNLGVALGQTGRTQEAMEQWEQVLRINPDSAEAHNNLGLALAQLGRVQEAMGHWEEALRIKPDYPEAHYNLGLALEHVGRSGEAIEHYKQALTIRPDLTAARNALQRLGASQ
jgi:tetratricopeptide (TPR) repeat protein